MSGIDLFELTLGLALMAPLFVPWPKWAFNGVGCFTRPALSLRFLLLLSGELALTNLAFDAEPAITHSAPLPLTIRLIVLAFLIVVFAAIAFIFMRFQGRQAQ